NHRDHRLRDLIRCTTLDSQRNDLARTRLSLLTGFILDQTRATSCLGSHTSLNERQQCLLCLFLRHQRNTLQLSLLLIPESLSLFAQLLNQTLALRELAFPLLQHLDFALQRILFLQEPPLLSL